MAGRTRSDSVHVKTELFDTSDVEIPKHLKISSKAKPYFLAITRLRVKSSWNDSDLQQAMTLAMLQEKVDTLRLEIDEEGDTMYNSKGDLIVNPKHKLLDQCLKNMIPLARAIQVHAVATIGEAYKQRGQNSAAIKAREEAMGTHTEDSLLALPS